jgi:hypothetical protein
LAALGRGQLGGESEGINTQDPCTRTDLDFGERVDEQQLGRGTVNEEHE